MAVDDIYKLTVLQEITGIKCANIYHFKQLDDEADEFAEASLASVWDTDFAPHFLAMQSAASRITAVVCQRIWPTVTAGFAFVGVNIHGLRAHESLPPDQCLLITLYSDTSGPAGRGRTHISAICVTDQSGGQISLGLYNLAATFADLFTGNHIVAPSAIHWKPVLSDATGASDLPIVGWAPRGNLRTLRSRTR